MTTNNGSMMASKISVEIAAWRTDAERISRLCQMSLIENLEATGKFLPLEVGAVYMVYKDGEWGPVMVDRNGRFMEAWHGGRVDRVDSIVGFKILDAKWWQA